MGLFYSLFSPLVKRVRTSPLLIQWLWKIKIPPGTKVQWDTVTLVMRSQLARFADINGPVLEIGIGSGALNSLYYAVLSGNEAHGTDISEVRVTQSKNIALHNRLKTHFFQSDLFDGVKGNYDLIFFNPPYVPTKIGRELNITGKLKLDSDRVWDGGEDGMDLIRRFLNSVPRYLSKEGRVLIGVQDIYIAEKVMTAEITRNQLQIEVIHRNRLVDLAIPTSIYELRHAT